jgi:hypothetical protein
VRHGKVERLQLQLAAPTLNSILSVVMHEWMTYGAQMQKRRWRCGGRGGDDVFDVMNARVFPEFGRDKRSDIPDNNWCGVRRYEIAWQRLAEIFDLGHVGSRSKGEQLKLAA